MWLLLIVLLNVVPGFAQNTLLNTYTTAEECERERNRVGYDMAEAYPYERDFVIVCQVNPKQGL